MLAFDKGRIHGAQTGISRRKRRTHDDEPARKAFDEGPSKSALKRQDQDLRAIGVELVELPARRTRSAWRLPEKLYDAVMACRSITAHGARLRQEMYIAKVMRGVDVEPIRDTLARRNEVDRQRVRRERVIEQWRERLLADEPAAWTELADPGRPGRPAAAAFAGAAGARRTGRPRGRLPPARQLFRRLREALEKPAI